MSWIDKWMTTDQLVTRYFERHFSRRARNRSAIWESRADAAWRDATTSYFVDRRRPVLSGTEFTLDWTRPEEIQARLASEGHGICLTQSALVDLVSLHKTLCTRGLGPGTLSDDIYVMF